MKITHDLHNHTNLSSCAKRDATAREHLLCAKREGLSVFGFSDHLWDSDVPGATNWYSPQNVEHVLKLREELPQDRNADGVHVLHGCETEFTHEGKLCLTAEHFALFDYVMVPHSHTHMRVVMPQEYAADHKLHARFLMDSFLRLVNHPLAKGITMVAHPFVPGTNYPIYNTVQALIPDSYFREAFVAAREAGIAIEMNGSTLIYQKPEDIPHCEYVRIYSLAKECGCRFTYGSDSHDFRVVRKLSTVERFFDQCGITEADLLTLDEITARSKAFV